MAITNDFTWASIGRTYGRYMVVGAAAIPAGILYAVLAINGWERWWADVMLFAIALVMAHFIWRFIDRQALGTPTPSRREPRPVPHFPGLK